MVRMSKINEYKLVGLINLIEVVSEDFVNNTINKIIEKTLELDCKINNETTVYEIEIYQNFNNNSFNLFDSKKQQLIISLERDEGEIYYCKPFKLLNLVVARLLNEYNDLVDGKKIKGTTIYDELAFSLSNLNKEDKLSPYLFFIGIIFCNEFNLDLKKSKLSFYDDQLLVIDGNKKEFINNDEISEEEVIYLINIYDDKSFISVTKIYEDEKQESFKINLNDFYRSYTL